MLRFSRLPARFRLSPSAHRWAGLSTGAREEGGALYEFRTYQIRPDRSSAFLELTNEKIHLRTAHSELVGYWSVEYGALNQVFHIWKYDSFSHRAAVRAALAQDERWMAEYIRPAIPMLTCQNNHVAALLPWSRIDAPPRHGGWPRRVKSSYDVLRHVTRSRVASTRATSHPAMPLRATSRVISAVPRQVKSRHGASRDLCHVTSSPSASRHLRHFTSHRVTSPPSHHAAFILPHRIKSRPVTSHQVAPFHMMSRDLAHGRSHQVAPHHVTSVTPRQINSARGTSSPPRHIAPLSGAPSTGRLTRATSLADGVTSNASTFDRAGVFGFVQAAPRDTRCVFQARLNWPPSGRARAPPRCGPLLSGIPPPAATRAGAPACSPLSTATSATWTQVSAARARERLCAQAPARPSTCARVSVDAGVVSLPLPVYTLRWFESADERRSVESDAAGKSPPGGPRRRRDLGETELDVRVTRVSFSGARTRPAAIPEDQSHVPVFLLTAQVIV
uniref:Protein NipSnap homolog 3A-like n=1 Tax=Hippocampus comes TaxID=109280 RepID=A0A3Q3DK29_HIPCM